MIDIVKNRNNEMRNFSRELGFSRLLVVDKDVALINNFKDKKDIIKARKKYNFVVVSGKNLKENRIIVEACPDVVLIHYNSKRDFMKERNSSLNHVICKIASKNGVAVGIDFSEILNSKNRDAVIGRLMQNIKLCRKYKTRILFFSFASDVFELRAAQDIMAFLQSIGMTPLESKNALMLTSKIISKNKSKRHPSYIAEGIRIIE